MFPDNTYGRHHVTLEGTLEIKTVKKEDAGYYVCSAFSVAGSGTTRAFLEVSISFWDSNFNAIKSDGYKKKYFPCCYCLYIFHPLK